MIGSPESVIEPVPSERQRRTRRICAGVACTETQGGYHFFITLDNGRQGILLNFKIIDRGVAGVIEHLHLTQAAMLRCDHPVLDNDVDRRVCDPTHKQQPKSGHDDLVQWPENEVSHPAVGTDEDLPFRKSRAH
jgi:hypothetical protein